MRETILLKWPLLKKNLVNQRTYRGDCSSFEQEKCEAKGLCRDWRRY